MEGREATSLVRAGLNQNEAAEELEYLRETRDWLVEELPKRVPELKREFGPLNRRITATTPFKLVGPVVYSWEHM